MFFDPQGIYELDNQFILELSDASGDFSTSTILSTKDEFFIPVLNGVVPLTTTPGSGYQIKIRSTNPITELIIPNVFEVIQNNSSNVDSIY